MRQLWAFTKKELLEQIRTGKLLILVLCIPLIQEILALAERILQMGGT